MSSFVTLLSLRQFVGSIHVLVHARAFCVNLLRSFSSSLVNSNEMLSTGVVSAASLLLFEDVHRGTQAPTRGHRMFGANLRFYPIRQSYLDEVRGWYEAQGTTIPVGTRTDPTDFCQICDSCPFRTLACEIMVRRTQIEADERKKQIQLERGH